MTLTVDASVAIKWVLLEDDSERARALVLAEPLIAPDFLMLECANVLVKQVHRGLLGPEEAGAGLRTIGEAGVRLIPSAPHVAEAQRLALELKTSAYDPLYLAVALAEGATLVTADARFARAAMERPAYAGRVRML